MNIRNTQLQRTKGATVIRSLKRERLDDTNAVYVVNSQLAKRHARSTQKTVNNTVVTFHT